MASAYAPRSHGQADQQQFDIDPAIIHCCFEARRCPNTEWSSYCKLRALHEFRSECSCSVFWLAPACFTYEPALFGPYILSRPCANLPIPVLAAAG